MNRRHVFETADGGTAVLILEDIGIFSEQWRVVAKVIVPEGTQIDVFVWNANYGPKFPRPPSEGET